jgi:transposase
MIGPDLSRVAVYVRPGVTDMRKAINGLSILVDEQMELDPLSGTLFLFCNRQRRILKALYWDRNGFCLWQKKLEKHRFPWPDTQEAAREITTEQLRMLLDGIDFWNAHEPLSYKSVS